MARKPSKQPPTTVSVEPPELDPPPLTAKDRLFNIAKSIGKVKAFDVPDAEYWAIVDEQFIHPEARARARYHRNANESLCQVLETDERFTEAVSIAKGDVF